MPIHLSVNYKASKNVRQPHKCEQLRNDNLNSIFPFVFPLNFKVGVFGMQKEKSITGK